jgi:hypothetical protein
MFGTQFVGAIHGRLLTAWSTAGVIGPILITSLRDYQLGHGLAKAQAYDTTLYILAGLLVVGLICNLLVRPVSEKYFMTDAQLAEARQQAHDTASASAGNVGGGGIGAGVVLAWALVGLPLAWGVWQTLLKAAVLFK